MTTVDAPPPPSRFWLNSLLAAATLLSAWLLFQVQPMVAKRLVPWYGGGTAIWTTAVLFFQTGLLGGYLYAHLLASRLPPRRQVAVHLGLLLAATALLVAIPIIPTDAWKPQAGGAPTAKILATLAACVGLPYVVLSATAPLVQSWFARANPGRTPYRLYALSNFGSLAALLSYPFLVEPNLGVTRQGVVWSALFAAFAVTCGVSGWLALRAAPEAPLPSESSAPGAAKPAPASANHLSKKSRRRKESAPGRRRGERFFWLALPACASAALLAITAHLCQDVASLPLLWIVPLAVYLVTFIVSFERDLRKLRWLWYAALAVSSFAVVVSWYLAETYPGYWHALIAQVGLLFAIGMVCHSEVARMRPEPARLTAYYLSISAGGALGGLAVGVVAPLLFADTYELPLSIATAWILALAVLVTDRESKFFEFGSFGRLAAMVGLLILLGMAMLEYESAKQSFTVAAGRNFYGTLKVRQVAGQSPEYAYLKLTNGQISHGAQYQTAANRRFPTQYYHLKSGIGALLATPATAPRHVGIVGLGVGTLAAYSEAGDRFRFYEINPQVIEFADEYFTYLQDARERSVKIEIVPGDARLMLEREEPQEFDVLVLDAFSSDSIPTHLLTLEAFETYLKHLRKPDGVLALHLSSRHLDLRLVVAAAADQLGFEVRQYDAFGDGTPAGQASKWLLAYRPGAKLAEREMGLPMIPELKGRRPVLWTDDYNNILAVIKGRGG